MIDGHRIEDNVKSILEFEDSAEGRKWFSFLTGKKDGIEPEGGSNETSWRPRVVKPKTSQQKTR